MGKIVILMGASGSGKDTIYTKLIEENPYELQNITPCTTRPIRDGEMEGKEYYFKTLEQMQKMQQQNQIVELRTYQTIYGPWHYFTGAQNIDLQSYHYITINTLVGYDQFVSYYGEENILPILLQMDDGIRLQRALDREKIQQNPKYAEMCRRFLADATDFSLENIQKRKIEPQNMIDNSGLIEETLKKVNKVLENNLKSLK